jgi:hypothetical protein
LEKRIKKVKKGLRSRLIALSDLCRIPLFTKPQLFIH